MKRNVIVVSALALLGLALWAGFLFTRKPPTALMMELPFDMEQNNPVPMTLRWEQNGKSYYYFSWGVKPTAGYRLEYEGFEKNVMIIKAIAPEPDRMVAQVETYPKILLVLPKGDYRYRIVDGEGKEVSSALKTKRAPMKFTLWLPVNGSEKTRTVWRDPYLNNEGKTTAQIAIEALFAQPEMGAYPQKGVGFLGASFEKNNWIILMTKEYEALRLEERSPLERAIRKTVLGIGAKKLNKVQVVTDSKLLSVQEN